MEKSHNVANLEIVASWQKIPHEHLSVRKSGKKGNKEKSVVVILVQVHNTNKFVFVG